MDRIYRIKSINVEQPFKRFLGFILLILSILVNQKGLFFTFSPAPSR